MELFNDTPLAAQLFIGRPADAGRRCGLLTAKATFCIDLQGCVTLDTQKPLPLFLPDQLTPLGLLPRDDQPRNDDAFEVALLGQAHAPAGKSVRSMVVSLTIGDHTRSLMVFGDRHWQGEGEGATVSEPAPFTKMPLTWSRAFGGSLDVLVDEDSPVVVTHADNPEGMGFDPKPQARDLDDVLSCPAGFPSYLRERRLPNVERPEQLIRRWNDVPEPAGWAPLPTVCGIHDRRSVRITEGEPGQSPKVEVQQARFYRAHPDWILTRAPQAGAPIVLEGLTPEGRLSFPCPSLAVHLDYILGPRSGTRQLVPHALLLLPDQRQFTMVFRLAFEVDAPSETERSARLRVEGAD